MGEVGKYTNNPEYNELLQNNGSYNLLNLPQSQNRDNGIVSF